MANVKLIIEMPEEDYNQICETKLWNYGVVTYIIHRAFSYIKNGILLPKEHGAIKDVSEIAYNVTRDAQKAEDRMGYGSCMFSTEQVLGYLNETKPIIEANK